MSYGQSPVVVMPAMTYHGGRRLWKRCDMTKRVMALPENLKSHSHLASDSSLLDTQMHGSFSFFFGYTFIYCVDCSLFIPLYDEVSMGAISCSVPATSSAAIESAAERPPPAPRRDRAVSSPSISR